MEALKTMTREAMIDYLKEKLTGDRIMAVELGDTIVIKQEMQTLREWAAPIWREARRQRLTDKDIKALIKEARLNG